MLELSRHSRTRVRFWRRAGFLCALLASLAISAPASAVTTNGPPPQFNPPKSYYLALGDSFTYGFQLSKALAGLPPAAFDTGYVDVFAARLRAIRSEMVVVNYGCPGESTVSFVTGPCPWTASGGALHDSFQGSQLAAAVAFLRAHPGQVSPITLQLFGNDMLEFGRSCAGDFSCIQREAPAAIAQFGSRLTVILGRLRDAAPEAEMIVMGGWNGRVDFLAETDPLFQAANGTIAAAAAQERARFADVTPAFNPPGEAARITAICSLTLFCSEGDGHPSDSGYRAIADLVFDVSDYARLID
jgi:lysophospholipase L1-like esterase